MSLAAITENKKLLFWALQFWGWSAWAVTPYLGVAFVQEAPSGYPVYLGIIAVIGMVLNLRFFAEFVSYLGMHWSLRKVVSTTRKETRLIKKHRDACVRRKESCEP